MSRLLPVFRTFRFSPVACAAIAGDPAVAAIHALL
jgi:hypothetical protein